VTISSLYKPHQEGTFLFKHKKRLEAPQTAADSIAYVLSTQLIELVELPIEILTENVTDDLKLSRSAISEELLFYLLHCLDRCASAKFEPESKVIFSDQLGFRSLHYFETEHTPRARYVFATDSADTLLERSNQAQLEYSRFKIVERGGPLGDDLFWNFGKRICFMGQVHNPVRVTRMASYGADLFLLSDELTSGI
jgi:hypothetical protein